MCCPGDTTAEYSQVVSQDREEVGHHTVQFLQLPAHKKATPPAPPQLDVEVGEQVVRTPPLTAALLEKHYSSSVAPGWSLRD